MEPVLLVTPEEHEKTLVASVAIIHRFVTDVDAKLRFGIRVREALRVAMLRGEHPQSYRLDWLRKTAVDLFGFLGERARQFNDEFPQDHISRQDLLDVLNTAVNQLVSNSKKIKDGDKSATPA